MARKRQKQKKNNSSILEYRRLSADELRERIASARGRHDLRAAIDMAKECHRRDASPAHAQLLCDQYVGRAHQLMEKNLSAEAMTVLGFALQLGKGSPELLRLAFECGLRSGDYDAASRVFGRLEDGADKSRARTLLADEAVAKGEAILRLADPELRDDAGRIRRAFAAFETGDDTAASAELKSIGLRSPLAAWKWLLLGLAAHARRDGDAARKCWARAEGDSAAVRLARSLAAGLDDSTATDPTGNGNPRPRLDDVLGQPRLTRLRLIQEALRRGRHEEALDHCRALIAMIDPAQRREYAVRLGRAVCAAIDVDPGNRDRLRRLFGPLPEDPDYIRTAAVHQEGTDTDDALYGWKIYVRQVPGIATIAAPQRRRALAMIWSHMGDLAARTEPPADLLDVFLEDPDSENEAEDCYRTSVQLFPDCLQTQAKLLDVLRRHNRMKEAEAQAEQILARWPDHVESLLFAAERCLKRAALRKALDYYQRAREAEPFNGKTRDAICTCLMLSARRRLENGNVDLARKDYEQAAAIRESGDDATVLYCKWAALEWRCGDVERAKELFDRARAGATDPLCVYYQLAIELARAGAPAEVRHRFEVELAEHWRGRPTATGAVVVARLTMAQGQTDETYRGQEAHRRAALEYLARSLADPGFTENQWQELCRTLMDGREYELAGRFAEKAAAKLPKDCQFPLIAALCEGKRAGGGPTRKCVRLLKRARKLAEESGETSIVAAIETLLHTARMASRSGLSGLIGRIVGSGSGWDEEDDDNEFFLPPPVPRREGSGRRSRPAPADPLLFPELHEAEAKR